MDDAYSVPPMPQGQDGMGGQIDGGIDGGMPQDGEMPQDGGMEPPMGGEDPNAMGGEDPNMPPMGEDPNGGDDSTMSIINQLSDIDKEAVRSYAESMLNRDEQHIGTEDSSTEEQPMMERAIFTKKQIKEMNENFGPSQDELDKSSEDRKPLNKKKNSKISLNSPFNSPKFK